MFIAKYPTDSVVSVKVFNQVWPSTALGFGGVGGDAMTTAQTVVVQYTSCSYTVFFNGRPAYLISNPTHKFYEDLKNENMASVSRAREIY